MTKCLAVWAQCPHRRGQGPFFAVRHPARAIERLNYSFHPPSLSFPWRGHMANNYLFTSESVSEGHPDKVADQISDALIDHFLAFDPASKVACETLVTTGQVVLAGEVKSSVYLDVQTIAREVIRKIGYTRSEYMFEANSCGIFSAIHEQSADINRGVERR